MSKFIINILAYCFLLIGVLEITIRTFSLTNDVPQREKDINGLQVFKKNQEGIAFGHQWKVNSDGFLGHNDKGGTNQLMIIGDSFIAGFHNPFGCKQSSIFKSYGFDVFEIGRPGITFIEAIEFYKFYEPLVNPHKTIFLIANSDLKESIFEIKKKSDMSQFSVTTKEVYRGEIKAKRLKKVLYNFKTLYYLFLKYKKSNNSSKTPFFNEKTKNFNEKTKRANEIRSNDNEKISIMLDYIGYKYNLSNCLFVFRDKNDYKLFFEKNNINYLELKMSDKRFKIKNNNHWNCLGHKVAAKKIFNNIN